jgi:hypothetical protein
MQEAPLGVHLRHPIAETTHMPYMGPIDEFGRKWARNDYPVLAMWEAGIRTLRLPLQDLRENETRKRLHELHKKGHRYLFFTIGIPPINLLQDNSDIIESLEIIVPWESVNDILPSVSSLRSKTGIPVYVANIESSIHRKLTGGKFSHYISHGFHMSSIESLEEVLPDRDSIDGFVFQVNHNDSPLGSVKEISEYSEQRGFKATANVWLATEDPAEYLTDEVIAANKVAEAVVAAYTYSNVKVFLDTFIDHDRGYFPRIGLYDRRINPRKAGKVLKNLQAALSRYGSNVSITGTQNENGGKIDFVSENTIYSLWLPMNEEDVFTQNTLSMHIDLVSGVINPDKFEPGSQILVINS